MFQRYDVLFGSAEDGTVFVSIHTSSNPEVLAVLRDNGFVLNPGPGPTTFLLPGLPLAQQQKATARAYDTLPLPHTRIAYLITTAPRAGTSLPDVTLQQTRAGIRAQTRNPELVDTVLADHGFRPYSWNHALNERHYLLDPASPAPAESVLDTYQALVAARASINVLHPLTRATPLPPRYTVQELRSLPLRSWPRPPAGPHPYPTAAQRTPRKRASA